LDRLASLVRLERLARLGLGASAGWLASRERLAFLASLVRLER
jgi:hypothetical protein